MNFDLPTDLQAYIQRLDAFIHAEILPLQHRDDNDRFFDHRRESSRTQWQNAGLPTPEWESLLAQARRLADAAGFYRFPMPAEFGGSVSKKIESSATNLWMCAIRLHLASHPTYGGGLGLANDLQTEHSVVGNFPDVLMLWHFGSERQRAEHIPARLRGEFRSTFGLTEPGHGSDATFLETTATPVTLSGGSGGDGSGDGNGDGNGDDDYGKAAETRGYAINGTKKWQTGMHAATHMIVFARTSGAAGSARGITAFIVPVTTPGVRILSYEWTLNMPTDHATVELRDVRVPESAVLGPVDNGLAIAQTFTHENRIRQAASSCGAAMYCVKRSVEYAKGRRVFGKPLAQNQAVQWPLVELSTQAEMLRLLILRTANEMDMVAREVESADKGGDAVPPWVAIERKLGGQISMCNYYANRLATQAADNAIQVHGGEGYSRHLPFEHIWRHFRRYRITEGSEEVQMRRVAGYLFGYKSADDGAGKGRGKDEGGENGSEVKSKL